MSDSGGRRASVPRPGLPAVLDPEHPAIRRAVAALREAIPLAAADPARPAFHFRPPARWMNDPNGTIHHDGWYHLFYQHNPFGDEWGSVHWGHARSLDLVRWEHLPVALAPTREAGEAHCFSGCAWTDADGRPLLFYTSWPEEGARRAAEQWVVECDDALRRFEKPAANPVLAPGREGVPRFDPDWRDPFVFEEAGRTFMLLGATRADEAVVALFEARDAGLRRWAYRGDLHRAPREEVAFFECPALSRIDGRHLLLASVHGPVEYLVGDFDPEAGGFAADRRGRIDRSAHFYAPGFFAREPRGRHVLVGWVRGWPAGRGWNGVLGLPRTLSLGSDGTLRQRPFPGLASGRGRAGGLPAGTRLADRSRRVEGVAAPGIEIEAALVPGEGSGGIRIRRGSDGALLASVALARAAGDGGHLARIEARTFGFPLRPGEPPAAAVGAARPSTFEIPLPAEGRSAVVKLRLFWDRSLLEVFLGDGREACTLVTDANGGPASVEAFSEGGAARFASLEAWAREPIW